MADGNQEERIARLICREMNGFRTEDLVVASHTMNTLNSGFVVLPGPTGQGPLWRQYIGAARRILADIAEQKGETYGG